MRLPAHYPWPGSLNPARPTLSPVSEISPRARDTPFPGSASVSFVSKGLAILFFVGRTVRESLHRTRQRVGQNARAKVMVKVLDFVQLGGPDLTVDSTVFEMWMGL